MGAGPARNSKGMEKRGKREQEEKLYSPVMYHNVEFSLGWPLILDITTTLDRRRYAWPPKRAKSVPVIGHVTIRNLPDQDLEVFCCVRIVVLTQRSIVETRYVSAGLDRLREALNKAIAERQIGFAVFAVFLEGGLVALLDGNGREALLGQW